MDTITAYEIEKMMLGLQDKTIIFVSHNFSGKLIHQYDQIVMLKEGKVLSQGTHEELLISCSEYKKILSIKMNI